MLQRWKVQSSPSVGGTPPRIDRQLQIELQEAGWITETIKAESTRSMTRSLGIN